MATAPTLAHDALPRHAAVPRSDSLAPSLSRFSLHPTIQTSSNPLPTPRCFQFGDALARASLSFNGFHSDDRCPTAHNPPPPRLPTPVLEQSLARLSQMTTGARG
eukprot:scaffold12213_cov115-Isochrysis_galbana.AAC.4